MKNDHYTPLIKEVKPISFLLHRAETTLANLQQFLPVAVELYAEAVKYNLRITGPIHWHYFDFSGDAAQPFTLEVSLPISEILSEYDGKFHFKRTELFRCVSVIHDGSWLEIPTSYGKIMTLVQQSGLEPIGVNREIYINSDLFHADANSTEIQFGVK